jgi:hypothetical protein
VQAMNGSSKGRRAVSDDEEGMFGFIGSIVRIFHSSSDSEESEDDDELPSSPLVGTVV